MSSLVKHCTAAISLDLNLIQHLQRDLETAVGRRHPHKVRDLERVAQEDCPKFLPRVEKSLLMLIESGWF